jgi:hypothetical protein
MDIGTRTPSIISEVSGDASGPRQDLSADQSDRRTCIIEELASPR